MSNRITKNSKDIKQTTAAVKKTSYCGGDLFGSRAAGTSFAIIYSKEK
jgi:hypothetical protein